MSTFNSKNITIFQDPSTLAKTAADLFISMSRKAIANNGRFSVALAGGTTPKLIYELLAGPLVEDVDWTKVYFFWGDERFVPLDHPDSTYLMVKNSLLTKAPILSDNIFIVPTTNCTVEEAAVHYSNTLVAHADSDLPRLDLVLLGMGPDGHTASLFPNSTTLNLSELIAIEYNSPKPPSLRITMTHRLINNADNIIVMVTGSDKAHTLHDVLGGKRDINKFPIQGVCPTNGKLFWLVDQKAADKIKLI